MGAATLTIDLDAVRANWRALDAMSRAETAAVVKADGYGLGAARVGAALAEAGARTFFVALAEEGATLRAALGPGSRIFVFSGLMPGDEATVAGADLIPLVNSVEQARRAAEAGVTAGLQIDSGMNRLGVEPADLSAALDHLAAPVMAISHLACADEPDNPQNGAQRHAFEAATRAPRLAGVPRSLAATGGVLLGADYHYDLTRPGVGLYGGLPFADAAPVVTLTAPVIQVRDVAPGEAVGYGALWRADRPSRIATVSAGYADGLIRAAGEGVSRAPQGAGRVSMDLLTLDVTDRPEIVEGSEITLLGPDRTVDDLADAAGTIGYEILTSLGTRYARRYKG